MREKFGALTRRLRTEQGSLLLDVLIGLFILGIVLGYIIPQYLSPKSKGIDGSLKSDLHVVALSIESFKTNSGGSLPASIAATATAPSSITIDGEQLRGDANNRLQTFRNGTEVCIVGTRAAGSQAATNPWVYVGSTIKAGAAGTSADCGTGTWTAF